MPPQFEGGLHAFRPLSNRAPGIHAPHHHLVPENDIHRIEGIAQGQACAVKTFGTTGGRHADEVAKASPGRAFLTQDVFPAPEDLAAIDKGLGLGRQTVEIDGRANFL